MATSQINGVIQYIRTVLRDGAGVTDGQLLEDYISCRDEAAFAALLRQHGPMVWGVCRRVLSNHHDAEDAFQATFLVLVRRAASIASRELLANWLYGVAHQAALKARATAAKRKGRERQVTDMPEPAVTQQDQWRDLQPVLDEELSRLPDKYRGVIVLCDLEGKTRTEAARQLGCAEGTVASRLARARNMLAKRLTQRGVALSGGALAVVLAQQAVSAGVPNLVVDSTIKAAILLARGKAAATGAISVKVAALTEGVMKAMLFTKLKAAIAVALILGFVATGTIVLTCRTAAGQGDKPPVAEKPVNMPEKQEFVGGKIPPPKTEAAKGLKLTLSADKTETWMDPKVAYGVGAVPVKLKLTFTNTGDKPIKLDAYALQYRIKFQCDGPSPDSVKKVVPLIQRGAIKPPTEKDYPVLQPGKSWSPSWTPDFPGGIPDGADAAGVYYLRQPGIYKLRMTVHDKYSPHVEGSVEGTKLLESNELELKVLEKAPAGNAKGLKLTLSADKTETRMQPDGKNAVPVNLKLTFTNSSDKPIKLDAYVLPWRMGFRCVGPTAESVKASVSFIKRPVNFLPPQVAEDFPVLQPGKSWSPNWTRSFPGVIEEGYGKEIDYALREPGTYKLRITLYENLIGGDEPQAKRTTWLDSNELELKVVEKEGAKPRPEGGTAKGLKLTLSADKTETRMKPGEDYGALPVKLKLTFTNTSDKPIKLNAYALPFRIKFHCDGPSPDSIRTLLEYVQRKPLAPATDEDSPVLQPGKSWSPKWNPSFPGDIPEGYGKSIAYYVRQPGTYKLRMTVYENMVVGQPERIIWLESNELELKVREKE